MVSEILDAMQDKAEKKYRAVVDHTGGCGKYRYKRGEPVVLPESVIRALGNKVRVFEEVQDDVAGREPAKPLDRMIHGNETVKK